jgi:methylated-DNA-protein-cysteine methyltransferase related protein
VAERAGTKSPRVVGNILHRNTDPISTPCHRVVNHKGKLAAAYAFGGSAAQAARLRNEGIGIVNNQVDLHEYLWKKV